MSRERLRRATVILGRPGLAGTGVTTGEKIALQRDTALAVSRVFDVRGYGVTGTDPAADLAGLQACATACRAGRGTYFVPADLDLTIPGPLDLRHIYDFDIRGVIRSSYTAGPAVTIGSAADQTTALRGRINQVSYANPATQTNVALRIVGVKNAQLNIEWCPYLQLYANGAVAADGSSAYSVFRLGRVTKVHLLGENGGWINGNKFHNGRLFALIVEGDYAHNDNKWHDPTLEAGAVISILTGYHNEVLGARGENADSITYGAGTWRNGVLYRWSQNRSELHTRTTVIDNGFENWVQTIGEERLTTVWRLDSSAVTTNIASAWNTPSPGFNVRPGFRKLTVASTNRQVLDTGIFPLEHGAPTYWAAGGARLRRFQLSSDTAIWRPLLFVYDANRQPLDGGSGGPYIETSGGWAWNAGGYYTFNSNVSGARIVISSTAVKYARLVLQSGSSISPFGYAELVAYVMAPFGDQIVDLIRRQMQRPLFAAGLTSTTTTWPTHSLLHAGQTIGAPTGTLRVTARADTTLAAGAGSGNSTVVVASATGMAIGDIVAILLNDDTTHFTTISNISGTTLTLGAALPAAAGAGNSVATNRFAFA